MTRRRAGRPRHWGRRTSGGGLVRAEVLPLAPSSQLLRHRRALVGAGGDLALAESPLGVLLARGLIAAEERLAGQRFAWLYRLTLGRATLAAADPLQPRQAPGPGLAAPPMGPAQAAWLAAREADFSQARKELCAAGVGVYRLVLAVAVNEDFLGWMGAGRPLTSRELEDLAALQEGLTLLSLRFGLAPRRRRDAG
ncbi:MAG: hypothetical protein Kilf2KO_02780 [Rhodospirillales bacterium]